MIFLVFNAICINVKRHLIINHLKTNNPIMLITEQYYNTDNKIPKVDEDLIHYYHKDGALGPRTSISIHESSRPMQGTEKLY